MHHHADPDHWLNLAANLAIVASYLLVPFTVLRYLPLTRPVRASGTIFFGTCALTHMSMAFGFHDTLFMLAVHVIQAVAVVVFVLGFHRLLRNASRRPGGGGSQ
jgi:hypothetical protein